MDGVGAAGAVCGVIREHEHCGVFAWGWGADCGRLGVCLVEEVEEIEEIEEIEEVDRHGVVGPFVWFLRKDADYVCETDLDSLSMLRICTGLSILAVLPRTS